MKVVQVSGVGFGYDQQTLFQDVTFMLTKGDRASLVAPNGAGKTTLLRIIAGELSPDAGSVTLARDVDLAYYRQSHELSAEGSVREALLSGFEQVLAVRDELTRAEQAAASGTEAALAHLAAVMDRYQLAGGDEVERRVDMIAQKLGFSIGDMDRPVASLSGGERGRLRLGITLTQPADLLLLDEPTNHLDLETIDWLESHLAGLPCAVLCVSHDRAFLDAVCTQTLELGHRSFRVYAFPYSQYVEAREADLEHERARVEHQKAQIAKTEDFIRRNIAAQKTKQAQSRRKMLEKLERLEVPEDVWAVAERVRFRFVEAPRSGDIVLEVHDAAAERGGRLLFEGFELLVRRGDRVGVLGPNGCGKTTLLHLLAGSGASEDRGQLKRGTNLCVGFYDQHLGTLDTSRSGIEEIRSIRGEFNEDVTRNYLARFRFWGDDPFRKVAALSGGERARLALAKLLLEPLNLLFLDEPTNHLDIPAAEILEQALCNFEGSLLVASHDRAFLETVTTRIVAFAPTADGARARWQLETYEGNFRDYVEQCEPRRTTGAGSAPRQEARPAATEEKPRGVARRVSTGSDGEGSTTGTASGQAAYDVAKRARREIERKRRRVAQLEREIGKTEAELERMRDQLRRPPGENWLEVAKLAEREQTLQKRVEQKITEWAELSEELSSLGVAADGNEP